MNNALIFLGLAVVIAVVGGAVVAIVHRSGNTVPKTAAEEFRQVLDALAPDPADDHAAGPADDRGSSPEPGTAPVVDPGEVRRGP